eukprot:1157988-Pelagomonas_calceolata.AAC.3
MARYARSRLGCRITRGREGEEELPWSQCTQTCASSCLFKAMPVILRQSVDIHFSPRTPIGTSMLPGGNSWNGAGRFLVATHEPMLAHQRDPETLCVVRRTHKKRPSTG